MTLRRSCEGISAGAESNIKPKYWCGIWRHFGWRPADMGFEKFAPKSVLSAIRCFPPRLGAKQ